jgi:dCMP deaminase
MKNVETTVPEKLGVCEKPREPYSVLRPRKEQAFMVFAAEMAKRATCDRLQVGAVFADAKLERILCAGYNGGHAGGPNGCDTLEPGACGCIHAEINALTKSRDDLHGSVCFVTHSPCKICAKVLVNRGVSAVVYLNDYRSDEGIRILRDSGITVSKYQDL